MNIALSNELLNEFFNYKFSSNYNKNIIPNLFKYLQPFLIANFQLSELKLDSRLLKQFQGNNLIDFSNARNENELINQTKLKLMLTTNSDIYPYLNINQDEIDINFTATYRAKNDTNENRKYEREKAKEHIKSLILDSKYINIIDGYLTSHWSENFELLKNILPQKKINITFTTFNIKQSHKSDLKDFCNLWRINSNKFDKDTIHDRYIITDKLEILLSSGLNYLIDDSKDFTYLVKLKGN